MSNKDDRLAITIAYPSYEPRARGINAKGKFDTYWKIHCSIAEFNLLNEAAAHVGITRSELIRWCAVKVAQEVLGNEHRNNADNVQAG